MATETEILASIAALEAKRLALVDVPSKGTVGRTSIDISDKRGEIDDELGRLRVELVAARSCNGTARRNTWGG